MKEKAIASLVYVAHGVFHTIDAPSYLSSIQSSITRNSRSSCRQSRALSHYSCERIMCRARRCSESSSSTPQLLRTAEAMHPRSPFLRSTAVPVMYRYTSKENLATLQSSHPITTCVCVYPRRGIRARKSAHLSSWIILRISCCRVPSETPELHHQQTTPKRTVPIATHAPIMPFTFSIGASCRFPPPEELAEYDDLMYCPELSAWKAAFATNPAAMPSQHTLVDGQEHLLVADLSQHFHLNLEEMFLGNSTLGFVLETIRVILLDELQVRRLLHGIYIGRQGPPHTLPASTR
jgi:hypothetical protein